MLDGVRKWLWPVLSGLLAIAVIILFVRPLNSSSPQLPPGDVATDWNDAIARLGIQPVYPPEEDMNVGDVWAVVADAEDAPLLGKAIRIAHIDLRQWMGRPSDAPVFPDTTPVKQGDEFRRQDEYEIAKADDKAKRIALSIVGFPGITIQHKVSASGEGKGGGGLFSASRDGNTILNIKIPVAETYGVSPVTAAGVFDQWCSDTKTHIYCTDTFVRRAVAYSVTDQVLDTSQGHYKTKFQLRLISRVYLTRDIKESSTSEIARAAHASFTAPKKDVEPAGAPAASLSGSDKASSSMEFQQVFQHPLVFGYRAVTFSLPPSKPAEEAQE